MRAIKIDAANRTVTEYENTGLKSLQEAVGGGIEIAFDYPDGSTCYVNEEGLLGSTQNFFMTFYGHQPFAGNGVIVGPLDKEGNDTAFTGDLKTIQNSTTFLTVQEIRNLLRV